jgi:O-acetyl-ADP-ribose deacetylase (regulator of RNase III)
MIKMIRQGPREVVLDLVGREVVIKQADLREEKGDGVIVPFNTAFAPGGASADALIVVDQARKNARQNTYDFLFPSLKIKNPLELTPGRVVLDLAERPKVAETGTAAISESIRAGGIRLIQEWDRVIAAFVRDQGAEVTSRGISDSTLDALVKAEEKSLGSVVMVPFGTGLFGISPERSASLMLPAIAKFFHGRGSSPLQTLTITMYDEGQFKRFSQTALAS